MVGVKISRELLDDFRTMPELGTGEPGFGDTGGSGRSYEQRRIRALEGIDKALGWLVDRADNSAKKVNLPGIGDEEFRGDFRELIMINVEDLADQMGDIEFLSKSPRYMLYLLTAGILIQNGIAFVRNPKNKTNEVYENS